jgi:hypothetical protein
MKFLISEYSSFLKQLLDDGYKCLPFSAPEARQTSGKNLLLRHDIDIDPSAAIPMAEAEKSAGAKSTYYVLLSNRHTNPLDKDFRHSVQKLAAMGHWVGLHFDATQYGLSVNDPHFSSFVSREVNLLEWTTGVTVDSVSFHRPARELLSAPGTLTAPHSHTYENVFLREIEYCSDSSGKWAYGPPEDRDAPKLGKPFHLLTHPVWWGETNEDPVDRITRWMSERTRADFSYELPDLPNPFGDRT